MHINWVFLNTKIVNFYENMHKLISNTDAATDDVDFIAANLNCASINVVLNY